MTDTVLVVTWVVFAHLVADFVLQNDWIAMNKGAHGRTGWMALGLHGFHVGLCLVPFAFAYGVNGAVYLVVVVATHMAVDRWKVRATRRAERTAVEAAARRRATSGIAPASGLGAAWSPWPGMLFLADQVLHLTIALVGWLVLLEGVPIQPGFADAIDTFMRSWDRETVHVVLLTGVVLLSLFIANTRGAFYFVLALVSPRDLPDPPPAASPAGETASATAPSGYTVRVGPIVATVEPGVHAEPDPPPVGRSPDESPPGAPVAADDPAVGEPPARAAAHAAGPPAVPSGAPAMIGATIGALERLLIVTFVLVGAEAAVGFVIAAKTIARFKQLDDRGFAEYYLLGTLASVSVAVATGLVAKAALASLT